MASYLEAMDRFEVPTIEKAPSFALVNGEYRPVYDTAHTYRTDTGAILGTVGKDYTVHNLRDPEIVSFAQPILDRLSATVDKVRYFGSKVAVDLTLPKEMTISLKSKAGKGDVVGCKASIVTSFDGSTKTSLIADLLRLACLNGMTVADRDLARMWVAKHTRKGIEKLEAAEVAADSLIQYFKSANVIFQKMIESSLSDLQLTSALNQIFDVKPDEETATRTLNTIAKVQANFVSGRGIEDDMRGTVWAGFNAVTEYLTHEIGVRGKDQGGEALKREESNFLGGRADQLRQVAFQTFNALV